MSDQSDFWARPDDMRYAIRLATSMFEVGDVLTFTLDLGYSDVYGGRLPFRGPRPK